MQPRFYWQAAALTDQGRVRDNNEDSVYVRAEGSLAIVADGMGGANAGEVASAMAIATVQEVLRPINESSDIDVALDHLHEAIELAHAHILARAYSDNVCRGMGSTIVVALVVQDQLIHMHVGDSRLYRWRQPHLQQLTRDHSLVQQLFEQGLLTEDEKRHSNKKNIILRALGNDLGSDLDHGSATIENGDVYLLCSDGLTDMLSDEEIAQFLSHNQHHVGQIAQRLIDAANDRGGRDNVSVALLRARSS